MLTNVPRESVTSVTNLPPARIRSAPTLALVQRVTMEADFTVMVKKSCLHISINFKHYTYREVIVHPKIILFNFGHTLMIYMYNSSK